MFSLMTHVTINTLRLSGSACVYGRVYWLLASAPWGTLLCPANRLPDWSWWRSTVQWGPAATQTEADTHSSTEGKCYFQPHMAHSEGALSFPPPPHKSYFPKLIINSDKKRKATKEVVLFPPDGAYGRVHPDALRVTSGSCRVPADWSTVERLEITLKLNLQLYNHTFYIFYHLSSHPTCQ